MSGEILLILRLALSVSLYAFLGWAFLTIWRDLKAQQQLLALRQPPPISLRLQTESGKQAFSYSKHTIIIGRDPLCDLLLEDATVSAQHARLFYRQSQWWLEDLRSTNGTFLNQEPVLEPVVVTSGDLLRCGQVSIEIAFGERPAS